MLTQEQVSQYEADGYLVLDRLFDEEEVRQIRAFAHRDLAMDSPRRTLETGSGLVRATHGTHQVDPFFADLVCLPRILEPARQLLGGDVYVHQFKINAKAALGGELWEWHQDSYFWSREDGMPEPLAINVVLHLDEVTDFNGPLLVVPGSHRDGDVPTLDAADPADSAAAGWETTLTAKLKYRIDPKAFTTLVDENGMRAVKGGAGTVLLFHPALVHGSTSNLSPYDRCLLIVSYNLCANRLRAVSQPRPEFLASRDFTPLVPMAEVHFPNHLFPSVGSAR